MNLAVESPDTVEREAALIAKQLDLPPCPAILARFNEESHAPHPDVRRLTALIGSDISLAATVIKTVNSPFFGLTRKATSVEQALSVLGLRASANLIGTLLLRRAFPARSDAALERYWDNAMRIAGMATAIAARLKAVNCDEAHTYVLFRDCGMLLMLRRFPQYAAMIDQCAHIPGAQFTRIEDTRFNFNHARVACALARSWSLAEPLCRAIFCHHEFAQMPRDAPMAEPPDKKLVAFGLLAEQIASLHANRGLCPDWIGAESFVLDTLGITADDIVDMAEDIQRSG